MLPNGLETCSQADWDDAIVRATTYARFLAHRLPRHLTVNDVVHTAVEKLLTAEQSFDLGQYSLAAILCGKVKSLLSSKGLAEFKNRMPSATEYQLANTAASEPDAESLFTSAEHDQIMDRVCELGANDPVFVKYIEAFRANFNAEEIAELLGVEKKQCYELNRKLKKLTVQALSEFKPIDLQRVT